MNVKFVIEGMEETGSNGLDTMILAQRDTFFSDVDYIIISDCGWLSRRPALTYGTRGNCYFFAEVVYQNHNIKCASVYNFMERSREVADCPNCYQIQAATSTEKSKNPFTRASDWFVCSGLL